MNLPLGYRYASAYAGIRKVEKDDLGLIVSDTPASAAAMFTRNRVQAAPVTLAKKHLRLSRGRARAILVNAGNANCATRTGDEVAQGALRSAGRAPAYVGRTDSPGLDGRDWRRARCEAISRTLPALVKKLSPDSFADVARAIMTTDTKPKTAWREAGAVRIAGMTKGAGMIQPNMATTLGFVVTDAAIAPRRCARC